MPSFSAVSGDQVGKTGSIEFNEITLAEKTERTPMDSLREKVAREMLHIECQPHAAVTGYGKCWGWDDTMPPVRERHLTLADAAIRAVFDHLMEPSEEMVGAAGTGFTSERRAVWQAMLTKAKEEAGLG